MLKALELWKRWLIWRQDMNLHQLALCEILFRYFPFDQANGELFMFLLWDPRNSKVLNFRCFKIQPQFIFVKKHCLWWEDINNGKTSREMCLTWVIFLSQSSIKIACLVKTSQYFIHCLHQNCFQQNGVTSTFLVTGRMNKLIWGAQHEKACCAFVLTSLWNRPHS